MKPTAVRRTSSLPQGSRLSINRGAGTCSPARHPADTHQPVPSDACLHSRGVAAKSVSRCAPPRRIRLTPLYAYSYGEAVEEIVIPKDTVNPATITAVTRKIGEGSFGQVFEADMKVRGRVTKVALKKMKERVSGSLQMGQVEIAINSAAAQRARGACAQYMGHVTVTKQTANPSTGLTEGLWLVWEYQGYKTLDSYLRQRDAIQRLAADLEVAEESVVPTVMKQIFEALKALHAGRIVHRDVKPMNLLFCEKDRMFRFIDLGACVDMRTALNFDPERSIFDPVYCAPEQYILPTDTPDLASLSGPLQGIQCWSAWNAHNPDRFDMFSAGLILMQMSIPKLRTQASLRGFASTLKSYEYDVMEWAERQKLPSSETEVLDAYGGAGWKLASALLRERALGKEQVSAKIVPRPAAAEVLSYRFFRQADKKAPSEGWVQSVLSSFSSEDEDLDEGQQPTRKPVSVAASKDSSDSPSTSWVQSVLNSFSSEDEDLDGSASQRAQKSRARR